MDKYIVNEIDLKRSKKSVLKNKKHRIGKIVKGALVGMSLFSAGASIAARNSSSIQQQKNNIALINRMGVGEELNTSYMSFLTAGKLDLSGVREHISNSKFLVEDQEKIYVNFQIPELNDAHKFSVDCAMDMLNEINEKTYTGMPKIVVNYAPTASDLFNPTSITVKKRDVIGFKDGIQGRELGLPFLSSNGLQTMYDQISIKSSVLEDPFKFAHVFTHELMHSLYGLGDYYLLEDALTEDFKTIMGDDDIHSFLSLNDIKVIDALTWRENLTDEQFASVKNFYEEYQQKQEINGTKYLKTEICKKLFENGTLKKEKMLENFVDKTKYDLKTEAEKIKPISTETYYCVDSINIIQLSNQKEIDVESKYFCSIAPDKLNEHDYSIKQRDDELRYDVTSVSNKADIFDNMTMFGDRFFFEYEGQVYYTKINNNFSLKTFRMKPSNLVSPEEYVENMTYQTHLLNKCKHIRTNSYQEILEQVLYNKIMLDYEENVFKQSFDISDEQYQLDRNFGKDEFSYNFSIDNGCDLKLVCEKNNGASEIRIINNQSRKKVQTLKSVDGVLIGSDMAFIKIGKRVIGMMVEEDKLIKEANGLYGENVSVNYNLTDNYENSAM